jgi:hypothetical protein
MTGGVDMDRLARLMARVRRTARQGKFSHKSEPLTETQRANLRFLRNLRDERERLSDEGYGWHLASIRRELDREDARLAFGELLRELRKHDARP